MNIKIVLAGAASALLLGSFAVAQTTAPSDPTAPAATTQPDSTTAAGQSATSADQYSADTAAQTGDTTMAGERG